MKKEMIKKIFLIPVLFLSFTLIAQNYKPKKTGGLYGTGKNQVDKGWYFGFGGTYMLGYNNEEAEVDSTDALNNVFKTDYLGDPKGKFGLFAEVGKFKMNSKKIVNYTDFGIAYKWFRGGEDYLSSTFSNGVLLSEIASEGSYSDHLISGHFNVGYRYDQTDDLFFVNGLGLNLDYHIITGRTGTPIIPNDSYVDGPNSLLGEIHYFFCMGFKKGRVIIMPIIETPILALYPFDHIVSTHSYFNTRARPFIFRVRFMFLKKGSKSCPAVYNPMGIDPNGNSVK